MDRVIRRNRTMFRMSIIALVLYVLYIGYRFLIGVFDFNWEQRMLYDIISNAFVSVVLLIGYVAVYVLWTPDNEGNVKKRPTWQFVLLLTTIFMPIIHIMLYNVAGFEWGMFWVNIPTADTHSSHSQLISITRILLPIFWAMLIILLIKCERKAKKIIILSIVSAGLALIVRFTQAPLIYYGLWREFVDIYYGYIAPVQSLILSLLLFIFTIIYTRQKHKEASLLKEQRGL